MSHPEDKTLFYEWSRLECDLADFVVTLQQAATQWLYNGAQLEQVIAVDVKVSTLIDEVSEILEVLGIVDPVEVVVLPIT